METGLPLIYSPLLNSSVQQRQPAPLNSLGGKINGQHLLAVKWATRRARQEVSPNQSGSGFTSGRVRERPSSQEEGGWKEANSILEGNGEGIACKHNKASVGKALSMMNAAVPLIAAAPSYIRV